MLVGLTYDLKDDYLAAGYSAEQVAEFDSPDTIDALEAGIRALGHETVRIGSIRALTRFLAAGSRCDLVFNIAEGMFGAGREAQVPALLDAWEIPYVFSDALVLALTLHKGHTKHVVRGAGIPTAGFFLVEKDADIAQVALDFPLFVKPVCEGTGKGIDEKSLVRDRKALEAACRRLLRDFGQPVLVEEYLPGREFTVGITGTGADARCLGGMEVLFRGDGEPIYSWHVKKNWEELVEYRLLEGELMEQCARTALAAWRVLGCRDGGRVDLRCDKNGIPNFIEVNPLAGLNPDYSDLPIICRLQGIPYRTLLAGILDSALRRMRP